MGARTLRSQKLACARGIRTGRSSALSSTRSRHSAHFCGARGKIRAAWQRPFHFPTHRLACHERVPPSALHAQPDATPGRRQRQSFRASSSVERAFSWPPFQELRRFARIIVHRPFIRQRPIYLNEMPPSAIESPKYICTRDTVAALAHASCNATERELWRLEPEVHNFNAVAALLPISEVADICDAAESRFEGKIHSPRC